LCSCAALPCKALPTSTDTPCTCLQQTSALLHNDVVQNITLKHAILMGCRFKPYWVSVEKMYNATASSNGLAQGGHRGLARVTAQQGSANLATPPQYESDTLRSESDDTASIQSDATSDSTTSSTAQQRSSNWAGAVAGILLAFCVGAVVGAVAYRAHEQHMSPLDTHSSELVEQHRLLNQQSSVSQNQNL